MLKFWNLFVEVLQKRVRKKLIFLFGMMILFFMVFDGIISYLLPLVIVEQGFSKTLVGIIMGTAAISGAFFDLVIYKIFKEVMYRRLFIIMFAVAFVYVFSVWNANSFLLFIIVMSMWGFYFDLKTFGILDFVSRYSVKQELSSNFGVLHVFQSLGYLLAPLIAGFVIIDTVGWEPFVIALVFLSMSAFFFVLLMFEVRRKKQFPIPHKRSTNINLLEEFALWKKVGTVILPILLLASFATILDSFFMAIGPIFAETLPLEPYDGFFMVAYFLPSLILGGFIGYIVKRCGEKKTALIGLLIGASILSTLFLFTKPVIIILIVFFASCFTSVMSPIIQSSYGHCIHDAPKVKKEVQELGDFFGNCGYIVGPIAAGMIADYFGNAAAFSLLGVIGIIFAVFLLIIMPQKFNFEDINR